jgi:hypothetical protein
LLPNDVLLVTVPSGRTLTRRQALRLGALATAAGAFRAPSASALTGRRDPLFELDLAGEATRASAAGAGWRTTRVLRAPRRFDLIGLRWADGSHAEAQVRARKRGGEWTRWVTLHPTGDHGPDEGTAPAGTDPAFTGAADQFQLRLRGTPAALRARFVRALPTATLAGRVARRLRARAHVSARRQASGAAPVMVSRAEWGADSVPPRADPAYGAVQMAFVHHTVNANDYQPEDSAGIVLGIARYHRDSNGWNDIGYNFLVDRYGQIFEGRAGGIDQPVIGAQAQGYNSVSTGVACLGTFESVTQTEAGMDALARIIGWKLSIHGVPVQGQVTVISAGGPSNRYAAGTSVTFQRISGHRDGDSTSCPGSALYGQLADLRIRAARYAVASSGLTVRASYAKVRAHRTVDVSGQLHFADGSSPGGAPLSIEFQAAGSAWTQVSSAACAPDGGWRATVTPPTSGTFRAVYGGDAARGRVESKPVRVDVIPRMSVALDRTKMRRGKWVKVTGTVDPAQLVQCVVERRAGRRWASVRSRNLDVVDGAFGVRFRLATPGIYRVTVISGTTQRRRRLRVL